MPTLPPPAGCPWQQLAIVRAVLRGTHDHQSPLHLLRAQHQCLEIIFKHWVRQSQLQLVGFGCGYLQSFFSWVADDGSPAVPMRSDAIAWSHRFAEDVQDGSLAAVCCLQNPEWMQCQVDNGDMSKTAAVKAILTSFLRSLLATGRLGSDGSGASGAGCI